MSQYLTPDEAAKLWQCPVARTFADGKAQPCRGDKCAVWRWKPRLYSDPEFVAAVKREMACMALEAGDGKSPMTYHKKAVERVDRNPEGFGITREQGCCGLGGAIT